MNFFKNLFSKKGKINLTSNELIDVGVCPNCWGKQEYNGLYVQYSKDLTKSNIDHDKAHQKAFVQQYIETEITGIQLKREGEHLTCPTCKTKYKYVSSKAN